ncbi:MAG: hypothetical protein AAGJ86_09680 [Pseudomonadota bacterium]
MKQLQRSQRNPFAFSTRGYRAVVGLTPYVIMADRLLPSCKPDTEAKSSSLFGTDGGPQTDINSPCLDGV